MAVIVLMVRMVVMAIVIVVIIAVLIILVLLAFFIFMVIVAPCHADHIISGGCVSGGDGRHDDCGGVCNCCVGLLAGTANEHHSLCFCTHLDHGSDIVAMVVLVIYIILMFRVVMVAVTVFLKAIFVFFLP